MKEIKLKSKVGNLIYQIGIEFSDNESSNIVRSYFHNIKSGETNKLVNISLSKLMIIEIIMKTMLMD